MTNKQTCPPIDHSAPLSEWVEDGACDPCVEMISQYYDEITSKERFYFLVSLMNFLNSWVTDIDREKISSIMPVVVGLSSTAARKATGVQYGH